MSDDQAESDRVEERAAATRALLSADDVDALFSGDDRTTVDLYIPEWKKTVRLRQLCAADLQAIQDIPKGEGMSLMVALSVVDASGNRLFKDHSRLNARSVAVLSRIQDAALKLNGLTGAAAAAQAAAAKNG
jgi:hypothetical protein